MQGMSLFSLDNVSMLLGGDALCQAIERPRVEPRRLGKSEMVPRRNNWTMYITGKNLKMRDDVTRRVLLARIDARCERPELRTFKGNPFDEALRNRGLYLWACLTVVLAYRASGMPGRLSGIGDPFQAWSDNVRSALVWLGETDPVQSMEEVRKNDPARQARAQLWRAMWNAYDGNKRTCRQMIEDAKVKSLYSERTKVMDRVPGGEAEAVALAEALIQFIGDKLSPQYLGNKLKDHKDCLEGGLFFRHDFNTHTEINSWFIEPLK